MADLGFDMVDDLAIELQPFLRVGAMVMPFTGFKTGLSTAGDGVEAVAEVVVSVMDDGRTHIGEAAVGEAVGGKAWCGHKGILACLPDDWKDDLWTEFEQPVGERNSYTDFHG